MGDTLGEKPRFLESEARFLNHVSVAEMGERRLLHTASRDQTWSCCTYVTQSFFLAKVQILTQQAWAVSMRVCVSW